MGFWSTAALSLAFLVLLVVLNFGGAQGKRGCANFGHSCYGGMGKRALDIASSNDEFVADMPYAQDAGLVFTGPRSEGYNSYPRERMSPQQYEQLSRILKQWVPMTRVSMYFSEAILTTDSIQITDAYIMDRVTKTNEDLARRRANHRNTTENIKTKIKDIHHNIENNLLERYSSTKVPSHTNVMRIWSKNIARLIVDNECEWN